MKKKLTLKNLWNMPGKRHLLRFSPVIVYYTLGRIIRGEEIYIRIEWQEEEGGE